ncbi:MAG: CBS domain-containing protein [Candidatus Hadarchaeum sp.]|uniref:CBS domain-containing protein n=1 Tax=Candidatus Hadarchaeum sp. TaxID=2883567 RepID=UPI003182301B
MRVSQIMSSPVIALDKDRSLADAIDCMRRKQISRIVAVDNDRVAGILTEKDIVRELGSLHAYRLPPSRLHISSVMTSDPISVAPEVTAKRAAELMLDHDISGLPVLEGGKLVGIVTKMDFAKVCMDYDDVYVGQVMQASPITVSPGDRVIHARKLLLEEEILALPVVENRVLIGIVTTRDVAMKLAAFQEVVPDKYKSERIRNLLVGDIMTQPPTTARTDTKLPESAKLMLEKRFSALPVLNLDGELVGLLTKTELTELARERL